MVRGEDQVFNRRVDWVLLLKVRLIIGELGTENTAKLPGNFVTLFIGNFR